jgi:hypothetical protein
MHRKKARKHAARIRMGRERPHLLSHRASRLLWGRSRPNHARRAICLGRARSPREGRTHASQMPNRRPRHGAYFAEYNLRPVAAAGDDLAEKGDECKNDALQLLLHHFLHPMAERSRSSTEKQKYSREERRSGQNTKSGGSDPTLCGFQPPKKFVGSLPPSTRWSRALGLPRRDAANNL